MTGWATYPYGCGGSLLHLGRPDPAKTWDWLQVTEFSSLESLCSSRREFAEKRCKGIAIILVSPFQKKSVTHNRATAEGSGEIEASVSYLGRPILLPR